MERSGVIRTGPIMSELRIILMGYNSSEISRVGNFILGRKAFNTVALPPSIEQQSERARGTVEGRYITLISTPHQLHPQPSLGQITEQIKESLYLCAPGPHIFLLVLQSSTLKEDQDRIKASLESCSPWFMKYSIVLTLDDEDSYHVAPAAEAQWESNPPLHLNMGQSEGDWKTQVLKLLEKIEQVVRCNGGRYLTYDTNELLKKEKTDHRSKTAEHVRMVLLGNNSSEICQLGNFILGREAFDTEAPPPSVEQHSERAGGQVEGRYFTLINTPHLFDPHLSLNQITARINECMTLCSPGPHVLLLVFQSNDSILMDWEQVRAVFSLFSKTAKTAFKHTIVKTQKRGRVKDPHKRNKVVHEIKKCGGQKFQSDTVFVRLDLVKAVDKLVKKNKKKGNVKYIEMEESLHGKDQEKQTKDSQKRMAEGVVHLTPSTAPTTKAWPQKLNLVLCGSNRVLKPSVSDLVLGQREHSPESDSACVKMEGEVNGRQITLVELPALHNSHLSEEEVMKETVHCISLCDPGVHAFLLILPEGHLTDEDKGELEKIQLIFGSEFNDHSIVLITQHSKHKPLDGAVRTVIKDFGERCLFFNYSSQVLELITNVEGLLTENGGNQYTTAMFLSAQLNNHLKYRREMSMKSSGRPDLGHLQKTDSPRSVRIILLGITASGKSASGNTILGKEDVFKEGVSGKSVTAKCQEETIKIKSQQITVIDTPGLFETDILTDYTRNDLNRAITMVAPGPHVFLLVVPIEGYNQDINKTTNMILDKLGEDSRNYTMLLFTRGDYLGDNSIEQFIENSGQDTKDLIKRCEDRYHVFNNNNREDRTQVTALLEKIDSMMTMNKGSCYTNEMFQKEVEREREEQEMNEKTRRIFNQQLLWYQKRILKRDVQQDDPDMITGEASGGASYIPH